ncbi:hypothetical protein FIV04_26040 (plasmid) [Vibrio sp. THAF190c]|nr:hypothetical protein FIV04_26040 [Vibrio sp. THAF190c]
MVGGVGSLGLCTTHYKKQSLFLTWYVSVQLVRMYLDNRGIDSLNQIRKDKGLIEQVPVTLEGRKPLVRVNFEKYTQKDSV